MFCPAYRPQSDLLLMLTLEYGLSAGQDITRLLTANSCKWSSLRIQLNQGLIKYSLMKSDIV